MKYDHLDLLPSRAFQPHSKYGMTLEGGGGGPSSSTTYTSNLSRALEPKALELIGAAIPEYFNVDESGNITGVKPYRPYSADAADYVAGFSPQQEAVFQEAAGMKRPEQFQGATQLANAAGAGALSTVADAMRFGEAGFQSGMRGQRFGLEAALRGEQRAQQAEGAAYGYGSAGSRAGLQGQEAGLRGERLGTLGGQLYGGMGAGYGAEAAALAPEAQRYGDVGAGYGTRAADIGTMALQAQDYGRDVGEEAREYARRAAATGQEYAERATSPSAIQSYMSPYQQAVVDQQIQAAQRQADIARTQRGAQAARAGAFGGARQAIENAEADRALQSQLQAIQAQGLQSAYDKAIQSMQYGTGKGLEGLTAAQAGLGTSLQGGQLGLSGIGQAIAGQQAGMQGAQAGLAGLSQAGQLYGLGMQGAQAGLAGVDRALAGTAQGMQGAQAAMQGAGVGLQGVGQAINAGQLGLQGAGVGLQGTGQGMQGAQVGLQGVSGAQAGYSLANQAAANLANIGTAQQGADLSRMGFQSEMGGMQQGREQQIINQAIQDYAMGQENPYQRLAQYSGLIRGYMTPTTTVSQYSAAPPVGSQIAGLGAAAYGLSQMGGRKKGGRIKEGGIERLALRRALKGGRA